MSEKQAKRQRHMQNGNPNTPQPQYSFQQLENFIALAKHLTGSQPKKITLAPTIYEAHVQEAQRHADTLGLQLGFKDDKVMFMGVELEKKVEIATAASIPQTPVKPTGN